MDFLDIFSSPISNFTEMGPAKGALLHAGGGEDGRTHVAKAIGSFHQYADACKN